ncbi:MAG TPA: type II secretion system F family protein [Acidimicrobiales bacterium]|nr:type II secretion system F family protein [Acidimicrobiales bacterium]
MALPLLAMAVGAGVLVAAAVFHRADEDEVLSDLLGLRAQWPEGEDDDDELSPVTGRAVELAGQVVERMDRARSLGNLLERAKIPLRPGEFVIVLAGAALAAAAIVVAVSGSMLTGVGAGILVVLVTAQLLRRRVTKRRKAFEAQLPDALSLVASSLAAGHTFLRAVQMMCEESPPPLSEEFARLVAETRLGDSVVEALERTALRLQIRDLDMVVQAIRIQQTVGGRLADLLHTLSDVIRARDEVRREVMVLTAEGRMSAYVLTGMVPFLFAVIEVLNPTYVKPLYSGMGLVLLIGCGVSVVAGLFVILRMVKIDV